MTLRVLIVSDVRIPGSRFSLERGGQQQGALEFSAV
jgi:hypothetical protein